MCKYTLKTVGKKGDRRPGTGDRKRSLVLTGRFSEGWKPEILIADQLKKVDTVLPKFYYQFFKFTHR